MANASGDARAAFELQACLHNELIAGGGQGLGAAGYRRAGDGAGSADSAGSVSLIPVLAAEHCHDGDEHGGHCQLG
jgi:hypothetical protein